MVTSPTPVRSGVSILAVLVLAGCSPASPPSEAVEDTPAPTVPASVVLDTGEPEGFAPVPSQDARSHTDAMEAGTRAVSAWVNTARGEEVWRAGLAAWLSPEAVEYYQWVDPRGIAASEVKSAEVLDASSPYLTRVKVLTSDGVYEVLMNRVTAAEPWQVQRVTRVDQP